MNRIKCIRMALELSQAQFASRINVNQTAVSHWENETNSIDIKIIEEISNKFQVPMDFICGKPFKIKREISQWHQSQKDEYENAPSVAKDFFLFKHGWGYFEIHSEDHTNEEPTAVVLPPTLTEKELAILNGYRDANENLKVAVELLFGTTSVDNTNLLKGNTYVAAQTKPNNEYTREKIENTDPEQSAKLYNAPEEQKNL